jgi:hypothetical protein
VLKLARASSVHHTATDGLAEAIRRCFCRGLGFSDEHGTPGSTSDPGPVVEGQGTHEGTAASAKAGADVEFTAADEEAQIGKRLVGELVVIADPDTSAKRAKTDPAAGAHITSLSDGGLRDAGSAADPVGSIAVQASCLGFVATDTINDDLGGSVMALSHGLDLPSVGPAPLIVGRVNPFACPSDAPGIGGLFGDLGGLDTATPHDQDFSSVGPQSQSVGRVNPFAGSCDALSIGSLFGPPLVWPPRMLAGGVGG